MVAEVAEVEHPYSVTVAMEAVLGSHLQLVVLDYWAQVVVVEQEKRLLQALLLLVEMVAMAL
jgi:hypothetical protein